MELARTWLPRLLIGAVAVFLAVLLAGLLVALSPALVFALGLKFHHERALLRIELAQPIPAPNRPKQQQQIKFENITKSDL